MRKKEIQRKHEHVHCKIVYFFGRKCIPFNSVAAKCDRCCSFFLFFYSLRIKKIKNNKHRNDIFRRIKENGTNLFTPKSNMLELGLGFWREKRIRVFLPNNWFNSPKLWRNYSEERGRKGGGGGGGEDWEWIIRSSFDS